MAPKKKLNKTEENNISVQPEPQTISNGSDVLSVENWQNGHQNNICSKSVHMNGHSLSQSESGASPAESSPEANSPVEALCSSISQVTLTANSRTQEDQIAAKSLIDKVTYVQYQSELQMPDIMRLIQKDLSEPYSIYTYRYFIHNWPMLCFLAMYGDKCVGAIVCKLDMHKKTVRRGYIAMLAVDENYRKEKIGSNLVMRAIAAMVRDGADEVVLETEITNEPALKLYENLGFVRDKRLFRYYLNGVDALRLKLWLK